MNGSNHDEEARAKPLEVCPVCLHKLHHNIKFNIEERYQQIIKFMERNKGLFTVKKSLYEQLL